MWYLFRYFLICLIIQINRNPYFILYFKIQIGFNGNATIQLCARWHELGAFYPFSRNHNSYGEKDQDPASLGPIVIEAAKKALETRYSLLPYLYTLFFRAHTYGDTVVRPLFFEFLTDPTSYEIETQFLWGSALMIVPTLYENATSVILLILIYFLNLFHLKFLYKF